MVISADRSLPLATPSIRRLSTEPDRLECAPSAFDRSGGSRTQAQVSYRREGAVNTVNAEAPLTARQKDTHLGDPGPRPEAAYLPSIAAFTV